eukprot:CAMPEP_0185022528 /NCGR_PEP_ID=MMETSP1103-20130426/5232_1 /TAXON_ID=36769 /ORGANISM="Paraphysomonas bandaiensis, Strain Caron Lab Isolate" /LENGTH=1416 /DNA_ID=CAMNT_0027554633 /DNA_START=142 /DNA_END=4389 /DNA_ORIENTATION=+
MQAALYSGGAYNTHVELEEDNRSAPRDRKNSSFITHTFNDGKVVVRSDGGESNASKIPARQVRKYFGTAARDRFFKHSNWLSKQREISYISPNGNLSPSKIRMMSSPESCESRGCSRPSTNSSYHHSRSRQGCTASLNKSTPVYGKSRVSSSSSSTSRAASRPSISYTTISRPGTTGMALGSGGKRYPRLVFDNTLHDDNADVFVNYNLFNSTDTSTISAVSSITATGELEEFTVGDTLDADDGQEDSLCSVQSGVIVSWHDDAFPPDECGPELIDPTHDDAGASEVHKKYVNSFRARTPDLRVLPDINTGMNSATSPRSKYILNALDDNMNPRSLLVVRKRVTKDVELAHYGMGDARARQLADSLVSLPFTDSIDLSDNSLTDVGLAPILLSAAQMPHLRILDLSENVMGPEAADAMAALLLKRPPTLQRLILRKADVDDFEGERFVNALVGHSAITELDLSNNKIGHAEVLNTVMPNLITATEALASLLRQSSCNLETLKVSWNMIRLDSAVDLASSLQHNKRLTFLDVSFNALGREGGQALGTSLLDNATLRTLLINNNNIDAFGCFVICAGIEQSLGLRKVCMDENPIGEHGAKALMNVPVVVGPSLELTAARCNTHIRDDSFWFDQEDICKAYSLDMSDPFQRAVAFKLLYIVANHSTCMFAHVHYQPKGTTRLDRVDLIQRLLCDREDYLDNTQRELLRELQHIRDCTARPEGVEDIYYARMHKNSEDINRKEFATLLHHIGLTVSRSTIEDAFSIYDIDGSDTIELHELLGYIHLKHKEAKAKIRDLIESQVMVLASKQNERWCPPRSGHLHMEVYDSYKVKRNYNVLTAMSRGASSNLAEKMGDIATLMSYAFQNSKLRYDEAFSFYEMMYSDCGDKVTVLTKILPQMAVAGEARTLVSKVTNDDVVTMSLLRQSLGQSLRSIYGLGNGFYSLNLSVKSDRICLSKLLELNSNVISVRMGDSKLGHGRIGDLSQKKNWSCFRNEVMNGIPITITSEQFTPMPKSGTVEFDFSGCIRPPVPQSAISDLKCTKILVNLALISIDERVAAMDYLGKRKKEAAKTLLGDGNTVFESSLERAKKICEHSDIFYATLHERGNDLENAEKKEEVNVNFVTQTMLQRKDSNLASHPFMRQSSMTIESQQAATSRPAARSYTRSERRLAEQDEARKKIRSLVMARNLKPEAKAAKIVEQLEDLLGSFWLLSRHVACIIHHFNFGKVNRTPNHGTYRVELVVALFSRIVDVHNVEIIMRELTPKEAACIYCRLGWLSIFNPMKPEGSYELTMSRWEERQVAKALVTLSVTEPGANFVDLSFKWERDVEPLSQWEVPPNWLTEEGMNRKGIFTATFYSGEGMELRGCKPNILMRRSLLSMVLISESEIRAEDDVSPLDTTGTSPSKLGVNYMMKNKDKW